MIKYSCEIEEELAAKIEEHLLEGENINWLLIQAKKNQPFILEGYFFEEAEANTSWQELKQTFAELPEEITPSTIEEKDWQNEYKKYLKPWNSRTLHWVPIWEKESYTIPKDHVAVYLDAGMAFGTGAHDTTQLCAERLIDYAQEHKGHLHNKRVIDAGCGSGILAISAKLLGFGDVTGFDIDPDSIQVSTENADFNNLHDQIKFSVSGIEEGLSNGPADVLMANILANILSDNAEHLVKAVKPGGVLILSGILKEEIPSVKAAFLEFLLNLWGKYQEDTHQQGDWADLCFKRIAD